MRRIYAGDVDVTHMLKLSGSQMYVPYPQPLDIEYMIVAGGGAGGQDANSQGGGGGAGRFYSGSATLPFGAQVPITIGSGGAIGSIGTKGDNGGNSTMILPSGTLPSAGTIIMYGGGAGGIGRSDIGDGDGSPGGSGGGGGKEGATGDNRGGGTFTGGLYAGIGYNGQDGTQSGAGAGGGAATAWVDGVTYAVGGLPAGGAPTLSYGSGGRGGLFISGVGRTLPTNGIAGIVKLRYEGQPKATGGTITQSGGYTYHTFTSNDTFFVISSFDVAG